MSLALRHPVRIVHAVYATAAIQDTMPESSILIAARRALRQDRTIDIVTTGARTGMARKTEIWFTNVDGRIIICGTPSASGGRGRPRPRDWLANLKAHPEFELRFKESLQLTVPARAERVTRPDDRRALMSARQTAWYRHQGFSVDDLVRHSPIVDVTFLDPFDGLNRW